MSSHHPQILDSPAARRNRAPILEVLREWAPPSGLALEIAAGTGQHAVHFAAALPHLAWQPSDVDAHALASIDARRMAEGSANLKPPIHVDVTDELWSLETAQMVVCINMIHISPWAATEGLMRSCTSHGTHSSVHGCHLFRLRAMHWWRNQRW